MNRKSRILLVSIALLLTVPAAGAAHAQSERGEVWHQEGYQLEAKESFQFRVDFEQIPVRRWTLVVDGGSTNCDVSVLRVLGEELVYYETRETRHEVSIPWGAGEEIMVVLTAGSHAGAFQVSLTGPPQEQAQAAYSYEVNRALESFAQGKSLQAEGECRKALKQDPDDVVAKVLLAGFLRDQQFYGQAAGLIDEALAGDLTGYMRDLAVNMRQELIALQAPLPEPVLRGVTQANKHLDDGNGEKALEVCERILDGDISLDGPSRGRFLTLKGRALEMLDRNFAAVDAFTRALPYVRSKEGQAVVYFHMGRLFRRMGNLAQAQGSYTIALDYGLPSGLELQAREALQAIGEEMESAR